MNANPDDKALDTLARRLGEVLKLRPDQKVILAQSVGFPKSPAAAKGAKP